MIANWEKKGRTRILQSMATRQEFLSQKSHRVRFVYLPKHSSWLNQIETIFGILQRRVLRRGNFRSTGELKQRLLEFIRYFNETFAKPFNWTFTGRPIAAARDHRPKTWKENGSPTERPQKLLRPWPFDCDLWD